MNFLRRLFQRQHALPAAPKRADVYYRSQDNLIAAVHRDVTGFVGLGDPAMTLTGCASEEDIGDQVLRAIQASRSGVPEEEARSATASTLKLAGASGWDDLEARWQCIMTYVEPGEGRVTIVPLRLYATGGYIAQNDTAAQHCDPSASEVATILRRLMRSPPLDSVPHEPSHT